MAQARKGKPQPTDKSLLDDNDTESRAIVQNLIYEAKIQELTKKIEAYKQKNNILLNENSLLGQTQAASSQNKKDIVEFLNVKVVEHEQHITELAEKITKLENEKLMLEEIEKLKQEHDMVVENLNFQNTKYKTELDELTQFKINKKKMETEMENLKKTITENEEEYKKTIYNMEKKMLQDKTKLRKEMLQKVNEVVLNFQKVADQQIAETTKRAIQENIIINSQLKKMSEKTINLLSENQILQQRNAKLKTANSLLSEIEKIIGKKNKTNQQVMKWLIEQKNLSNLNVEKKMEKKIFKDIENYNMEATKPINEKKVLKVMETMEETKELEEEHQTSKKHNSEVNNETKETEKNRSSHIVFQLNNNGNNNSNNSKSTLNDKNDNKLNKIDSNLKKSKKANKNNERSNSLSSIKNFNNNDSENNMDESNTNSKLVLHKMLSNNYNKLNSDIDLINRSIRLQELVNMLTSFFLFYPEDNNYPFVEVYDDHKNKRNKKEIKDFIDKKQILEHLEENIEDFNDQLAVMEEYNDDNNKTEEGEESAYNVEINEKYEKFPESRNIHIYETDDLNEVIEKMKILIKEKTLTTYDQETYFKKLIESKLKDFLNIRSAYAYRMSQMRSSPPSNNKTQLPSINNNNIYKSISNNKVSINEIIKQLPSHIDNSSIYKKQEFENIYQKRQINDKISKKNRLSGNNNEYNINRIISEKNNINNNSGNKDIKEIINTKTQKTHTKPFRLRNHSIRNSRIRLVE
ncbi:hypothetical protein H8356DRAFT_1021605 [Neocallimastix lanati (nom. inval.)]|nr:hypothetical protein H8356DRAFT_1021605 [Neocallimastix sp. JGI-2020a]